VYIVSSSIVAVGSGGSCTNYVNRMELKKEQKQKQIESENVHILGIGFGLDLGLYECE